MRVHTKIVIDIATGKVLEDEFHEYEGSVAKCDRAAQAEAKDAFNTAQNTATDEGSKADSISANLTPFLTNEMLHPQGYSQPDLTAMLSASQAGAGGASDAITGDAADMAARTRNPSAFTSNLDEAARDRMKAAAGSSENIAAKNAGLKQEQMQEGAKGLGGEYGEDTDAMLKSMGMETGDVNALTDAGKSGWLQNTNETMLDLSKEAANWGSAVGSFAGCPVAGTLYKMHDGARMAVELLVAGDKLAGIDDEPQIIEEIERGPAPIIEVTTENGIRVRNSLTHAYALPRGGFVVASKALGKSIMTELGPSEVVSVEPAGEALVFNIITDGSHTYCADGIWALGVGDAERVVNMNAWARAGRMLAAGVK